MTEACRRVGVWLPPLTIGGRQPGLCQCLHCFRTVYATAAVGQRATLYDAPAVASRFELVEHDCPASEVESWRRELTDALEDVRSGDGGPDPDDEEEERIAEQDLDDWIDHGDGGANGSGTAD